MDMRDFALQHKWSNRLLPLGYRKRTDGYLEADEEEVVLVRKIFAMYLEHQPPAANFPRSLHLTNKIRLL